MRALLCPTCRHRVTRLDPSYQLAGRPKLFWCEHCSRFVRMSINERVNNAKTREMDRRVDRRKASAGPCAVCGEDRVVCLDLHHIDPEMKAHHMGYLLRSGSEAAFQAELLKCVVLCSNCHRAWHWDRGVKAK